MWLALRSGNMLNSRSLVGIGCDKVDSVCASGRFLFFFVFIYPHESTHTDAQTHAPLYAPCEDNDIGKFPESVKRNVCARMSTEFMAP